MLMPEAASNLDDFVEPGKDEIGFAWKVRNVEPIAEAHAMNKTAHGHLRLHSFALNPSHVFTAPVRWDRIHGFFIRLLEQAGK